MAFEESACNRFLLVKEIGIGMSAIHLCRENGKRQISVLQRTIVAELFLKRIEFRVHLGLGVIAIKPRVQGFVGVAENRRVKQKICGFNNVIVRGRRRGRLGRGLLRRDDPAVEKDDTKKSSS